MAKEGAFNGFIEINGVDLSDHCREFDGPMTIGEVPNMAGMGEPQEFSAPGLRTVELTATYIADYAAGSVHRTHSTLFNNSTIFPLRWRAKLGDANSPLYSGSFFITAFRPIGGTVGGESVVTASYKPTALVTEIDA